MIWHSASLSEIEQKLASNLASGLRADEANLRLKREGDNALPEGASKSWLAIFFEQFKSSLIYVLAIAALVLFFLGETIDSLIVIFVLIFNAIVGSIQEGRAENTLRALKNFVSTDATVIRDGAEMIIPDKEVVRGDIILLREGDKIPADARLIETSSLKIDEAALTGESLPVEKNEKAVILPQAGTAEKLNMVFKGTHVAAGNGIAIVIATGAYSVIGQISGSIAQIAEEVPLAREIRILSGFVIKTVLGIGFFIFALGIARGYTFAEMFKTVVSLAVSIIPEGLPIVLTLVLATGAWRMAKRQALVKRLQAVESLGQATLLAVDKTGTITKNELVVRKIYAGGKMFLVEGAGYESRGEIKLYKDKNKSDSFEGIVEPLNHPELILGGKIAALTAKAHVAFSEKNRIWKVSGDPTEAALLVFGEKIGFHKEILEAELKPLASLPFSYAARYQAVSHEAENKSIVTIIGAPEVLLGRASEYLLPQANGDGFAGTSYPLSGEKLRDFERIFHELSNEGMRVVAFGLLHIAKGAELPEIKNIIFGGFYAMEDSLRPEVKDTVRDAEAAGIKIVMITGDHKLTAVAIARKAGIYTDGNLVLTGAEIDAFSEAEFERKLSMCSVFARVTPEHKLKIIRAYKKLGEVVAMTGDGVNDAPSLVAADLGVAMGKIGTEVAKEASDIVLLDDDFRSVISAVTEGRHIFRTLKKVILYLFSTSAGEVLAIGGALFIGYPLPVLPVQILWLNLVTDGFLDVALAMEPKHAGLLQNAFKKQEKRLIDHPMLGRIAVMSIPMMIGALLIFTFYANDYAKAITMTLTTLAIFQWFNALNCRSYSHSVFTVNPLSNSYLVGALFMVVFLQLLAVYNPFMQSVLHTVALTGREWLAAGITASSIIFAEELRKLLVRRMKS